MEKFPKSSSVDQVYIETPPHKGHHRRNLRWCVLFISRKILDDLIFKLYAKHLGRFRSKDAVFEMFAKAVSTGRIYALGKMIEKTFGKGALRNLGKIDTSNEDEDIQKLEEFVNSL